MRVDDPHIRLDGIYGTNREFILNSIPHIGKLMLPWARRSLAWANVVVVAQKLAPTFGEDNQCGASAGDRPGWRW